MILDQSLPLGWFLPQTFSETLAQTVIPDDIDAVTLVIDFFTKLIGVVLQRVYIFALNSRLILLVLILVREKGGRITVDLVGNFDDVQDAWLGGLETEILFVVEARGPVTACSHEWQLSLTWRAGWPHISS